MTYVEAIEKAIDDCYFTDDYCQGDNQEQIYKAQKLFQEFVQGIETIRNKCIDQAAIDRIHELPIDERKEGIAIGCAEILVMEVSSYKWYSEKLKK